MKKSLFITGLTGFIGRHLLGRLDSADYENVYGLSRTADTTVEPLSQHGNLRLIRGSIFEADLYSPYLASVDTVIHLAAVTGKARPEEYFKVNSEGTEFLLRRCAAAGVRNFLYISSIAAKFEEGSYHYAQSKRRAEEAVRRSGLKYTIIRPTIVIGQGSPILESLGRLARLPVVPIFGDGRARVQPIEVSDLVDFLLSIARCPVFQNELIELGGPEIITIEEFIERIGVGLGRKPSRKVHIPLKLIMPFVSFFEKRLFAVTPFTAGQLSSFIQDGVAESGHISGDSLVKKNVNEMLQSAMLKNLGQGLGDSRNLDQECRLFCRYLVGQEPTPYVMAKYRDAHQRSLSEKNMTPSRFDQYLIKVARKNRLFTKLVDAYTSLFFKGCLAKKKLVMLLAILESCPPTCQYLDSVDSSGKVVLFLKMGLRGASFAMALFISSLIFLPLKVIFRENGK